MLGAVWLLGSIVTVFIIPKVRHKVWRYEVHEHEIDIQSGIFVVTRVIVPMVRVQHVDTSQSTIIKKIQPGNGENFHGTATVHSIPALEMEEADRLRDSISRLARVTDDDV
nr:PH domain-containing protein [Bacillus subtilis]